MQPGMRSQGPRSVTGWQSDHGGVASLPQQCGTREFRSKIPSSSDIL